MSTPEVICRPLSTWTATRTNDWDRIDAPFGGVWTMTLEKLEKELDHLGADRCILELTGGDPAIPLKIRLDGWPHARQRIGDPVVVTFPSDHGWLRFHSDRYRRWESNVHAVALTLERLRAVERYGTVSRAEQYTGFAALPAASGSVPDAVKGLAELLGATVQNVEKFPETYVSQGRRKAHPDAGGTHEQFLMVQQAAELMGVK